MSYQVLARKWRPGNFSQVAGQAHVLRSLINALDNQRLHHAYLFTGTRGVGKTTLARILAKCLNCEEGVTSTPCETCDSCREINEGRFIDLIEVDAASRTKVEDTRELLENVQYTPTRGRYKVYLIDEVHMLSTHSFNALLKTLEEPPPHVKFLFATTDPQKLPITILSRCLQFNLKNLNPQLIVEYLQTVLAEEKIDNEEEALWQISAAASGSMRDALTLVDQAISYCQGKVLAKGVVEMLGIPPQQQVYELLNGMASKDIPAVLSIINEVSEQIPDYTHTLDNLLSALHRIAIAQLEPAAVDNSFGDKEKIIELAGKLSAEDVQLFYQMGLKGREDLRLSGEVRSTFEMLLIRMLVFSPDFIAPLPDSEQEAGESEKKKNEELELKALEPAEPKLEEPKQTIADIHQIDESPVPNLELLADDRLDTPRQEEVERAPVLETVAESGSASESGHDSENEPEDDIAGAAGLQSADSAEVIEIPSADEGPIIESPVINGPVTDNPNLVGNDTDSGSEQIVPTSITEENWFAVFPHLNISGIASNILANSIYKGREESKLMFTLEKSQSAVYSDDILPKISQAFIELFSEQVSVDIEIAEIDADTPAKRAKRIRDEQYAEMVKDFKEDDNVQELLQKFSGTLMGDSIKEVSDRGSDDRL
jgi:DNA polymerase III subunit gamma/tau